MVVFLLLYLAFDRRVSCGGWHTVVVTKSGACYSFGRGEYGRLGLGDTRSRYRPHQVR